MRVDAPLLVREATPEDAEAIGEVHAQAWRLAHRDLFEGDWLRRLVEERRTAWTGRLFSREFARNTLLLAVRDDRVVGFVHFGPHTDGVPEGEILDFYAHPTVWGGGVARTLMDKAWEMLRDARYRRVRLWTMAGANRARYFFASAGFEQTPRTREYDYGDGRPVLQVEFLGQTR